MSPSLTSWSPFCRFTLPPIPMCGGCRWLDREPLLGLVWQWQSQHPHGNDHHHEHHMFFVDMTSDPSSAPHSICPLRLHPRCCPLSHCRLGPVPSRSVKEKGRRSPTLNLDGQLGGLGMSAATGRKSALSSLGRTTRRDPSIRTPSPPTTVLGASHPAHSPSPTLRRPRMTPHRER